MGIFDRLRARSTDEYDPSTAYSLGDRIEMAAGYGFIAVSMCIGAYYGYYLGNQYHYVLGLIFAFAALCCEIMKPIAVRGVFTSLRRLKLDQAAVCLLLAVVCVIYSLAADLALSSTIRSDLAAARSARIEAVSQAREQRDGAKAELAKLPFARPVGELEAKIAQLLETKGANRCEKVDGTVSRRVCGEIQELKAEIARSQRRLELQKTVRDAQKTMNDREIFITHDDPLVQSLSVYALLLGYPFAADYISPFIALLLPLMIEVGSTFGLVMTRTETRTLSPVSAPASGNSATKCPTDWTPPDTPNPWLSGREMATQMSEVSMQRPWGCQGADSCAQIKLLQAVSERGGILVGGQRSIAEAIGIPKSTVNQALKALEKAGMVKILATTKGTVVELIRSEPAPAGAPA